MVSYYQKRKRKRYRKSRASARAGRPSDVDITIGEATSDFMKFLEQGLADGSIVAMGTFGEDVPDPFAD